MLEVRKMFISTLKLPFISLKKSQILDFDAVWTLRKNNNYEDILIKIVLITQQTFL